MSALAADARYEGGEDEAGNRRRSSPFASASTGGCIIARYIQLKLDTCACARLLSLMNSFHDGVAAPFQAMSVFALAASDGHGTWQIRVHRSSKLCNMPWEGA